MIRGPSAKSENFFLRNLLKSKAGLGLDRVMVWGVGFDELSQHLCASVEKGLLPAAVASVITFSQNAS
jgi:hypothetical protein